MNSNRKIKHFLYKERCIKVLDRKIKSDILGLLAQILIILLLVDLVCIGILFSNFII